MMKHKTARAEMTAQRLREILSYDRLTGLFTRIVDRRKWKSGSVAGSLDKYGYMRLGVDYQSYAAHRLAWLYCYGKWPAHFIDHINGDKTDNRINNLREASDAVNSQNCRKARIDNKSSGLLGVSYHQPTNQWRARIHLDGGTRHIGIFRTPEAAHQAYIEKKRQVHVGCTL